MSAQLPVEGLAPAASMAGVEPVASPASVASVARGEAPAAAPARRRVKGPGMPGEGSSFGISVATTIALLGAWWAATALGWIAPLFLPSPEAIGRAFVAAWNGDIQGGKSLAEHFGWSVGRVFAAFFAAVAVGVPIGLAMGLSRVARGIFDPPIEFYRPLPPLAYLPLIVMWLGIGETGKIIVLFLACLAPIVVAARSGVRSVAVEQVNAARSMGATERQVLRHVILPAALPEILTGMRIAMGFAWTTVVAAELTGAEAGLGQMVLNASNFLRTDIVIMGIVTIGIVAWAFDLGMRRLERWLVPWKGRV